MPLVTSATYQSPPFLANGHVQTCLPTLIRRVKPVRYQRQHIPTPDGDFLHLDWAKTGSRKLAVLAHGLEGSSRSHYIQGLVHALHREGWDAVAWNARGCGGELVKVLRFTHSGSSDDLQTVLSHLTKPEHDYDQIALIGFSLGGNLSLKYLGERGSEVDPRIVGAVAFSVPCDLHSSSMELGRTLANQIYMRNFLASLHQKIRRLMIQMPGAIHDDDYDQIRTFKQFDDRYTAPIHGFKDAEDYWHQSSSRPYLSRIRVPALLVNARNDPFLADECFPVEEAQANPHFFLEVPSSGGHVGFLEFNRLGEYWSERRAVEFLSACSLTHGALPVEF